MSRRLRGKRHGGIIRPGVNWSLFSCDCHTRERERTETMQKLRFQIPNTSPSSSPGSSLLPSSGAGGRGLVESLRWQARPCAWLISFACGTARRRGAVADDKLSGSSANVIANALPLDCDLDFARHRLLWLPLPIFDYVRSAERDTVQHSDPATTSPVP